jgi:hypothetical protein
MNLGAKETDVLSFIRPINTTATKATLPGFRVQVEDKEIGTHIRQLRVLYWKVWDKS